MISCQTNTYNKIVDVVLTWLTPERLKLYPPHIPVITILFWAVSQYLGKGLIDLSGNIIGTDFIGFYAAGKLYLSDNMEKLYDFHTQYVFQRNIVGLDDFNAPCFFVNPPFSAPFFSLFSMLGYLQGLMLWWIIGFSAIFFSVYFMRSEMIGLRKYSQLKLFRMCFLFFPSLCWFMYGQNTAISLLLYTMFFVMLRKNRDFQAGLILGILLYKPQLLIGPTLVLIAQQRWLALMGGAMSAVSFIVVGFSLSPVAMLEYVNMSAQFFNVLRPNPDPGVLVALNLTESTRYPFVWGNHGYFGFATLLFDNVWKTGADLLFIILSIICIVFIIRKWTKLSWNPGTKGWDLNIAATFALGLLLSPHLFSYDLMLLLLPLAIVSGHYPEGTSGRPLDSGTLLFWSAALYVSCFVGAYASLAQMNLLSWFGLPAVALQINTVILVRWIFEVTRSGDVVFAKG